MSLQLKLIPLSGLARNEQIGFWQLNYGTTLDPQVPNLPVEVPVSAALAATETSDSVSFAVTAVSQQPEGRGIPWKGPDKHEYRVHPEYADKPKRKKKRIVEEGPQVVIESDVTTQTGIIKAKKVTPARNVLREIQQKQAEAEQVRRAKLRAIALADDEWLMVA